MNSRKRSPPCLCQPHENPRVSLRQTWKGAVIDPEPAEDEAFAREVSMTWGEVCDVEVSGSIPRRML